MPYADVSSPPAYDGTFCLFCFPPKGKQGDAVSVTAALGAGANPDLGISFMFKVLALYDGSITAPIVRMLKEAADSKKAKGL